MPATHDPRPIGVFDSGLGGLTTVRELFRGLPQESVIYFGDTARLPYGTKSGATVARYALQTSRVLVDLGIKLLVVACNTASSVALPGLALAYPDLPVVGVIEPGARACCQCAPNGRIAVIATGSTVRGAAYQTAILRHRPMATIATRPAQVFVALAEEGWTDGPEVEAVAKRYLSPLLAEFPEGYRHLAYAQTKIGFTVKRDMPMLKGSAVKQLYDDGAAWLAGKPLER